MSFKKLLPLFLALPAFSLSSCKFIHSVETNDAYYKQVDELDAVWSIYKYRYIQDGQVVSLDENGLTTSEGQGYALLRAVWSGDRPTFDRVWHWTQDHLQVRPDKLFAWKWKDQVLDSNSATDADTDIALALVLASRRFNEPSYQQQALPILDSIWNVDVLHAGNHYYVAGGNWGSAEATPKLHVAYLAPYAYQVFAGVDDRHPWEALVKSSYAILHWIYTVQKLALPPEFIFVDPRTGELFLSHPKTGETATFSYDAFPLFWRVALDGKWFTHGHWALRRRMLAFFEKEWKDKGLFWDHYDVHGTPLSQQEGLALYSTVHALAVQTNPAFAKDLWEKKVSGLWTSALAGQPTPYYLHNWLWFDRAYQLSFTRNYREFLGFLWPFNSEAFSNNFPWISFWAMLGLFLVARRHWFFKLLFLLPAFFICVRYLAWRGTSSLNFFEPFGPFISVTLWLTECYCFVTMLLLLVQVGLGGKKKPVALQPLPAVPPTVDVLIPIYLESCDILEKTLIGASHIRYAQKKIYVLDDSHRPEVAELAARYGATYFHGPQAHNKATNLNCGVHQSAGELIVIFDTDHIPAASFLEETVPFFADAQMGFVQTPHHFYNDDIFRRTFRLGPRVPDEQVMFHHAIQDARNSWNGAFFVGSGAIFRRSALEEIDGFNPLSLTEDIHTSQLLHAAGWKSAFVNKNLAAGLNAENLSAYVSQRRRWMLGALQIFFKDNPLFCRGLSLRQRLGYFASLTYFFFPVVRAVIWITPLYFLLFHMHPILGETSTLLAYLIPYMVALLLIGDVLVPEWPRVLWTELYEMTVTFALLFSMGDLLRPKKLGFKVTPKGIVSDKRRFDRSSAWLTGIMVALSAVAVAKGLFEALYFRVEVDAFFFNLAWAIYFLVILVAALLVAWEKPQRRMAERIRCAFPFTLQGEGFRLEGRTAELSLTGISFVTSRLDTMPPVAQLELKEKGITLNVKLIYHEKISWRKSRCGWEFSDVTPEMHEQLIRQVLASADTWEHFWDQRVRSNVGMAFYLFEGIVNYFKKLSVRNRKNIRTRTFRWARLEVPDDSAPIFLSDRSADGVGGFYFGKPMQSQDSWVLSGKDIPSDGLRKVYSKSILPGVWRIGLAGKKAP